MAKVILILPINLVMIIAFTTVLVVSVYVLTVKIREAFRKL